MTITVASLVAVMSSVDHSAAASDQAPPPAAVTLRLNLTPGQTYYQRSVIQQRVVVTDGGNERLTNSTIGSGIKYEVLDRDDAGVHTLRLTYDWVRIRTTLNGDLLDYDSAKSIVPDTQSAVQYAAQVGQTFVITMAADGRILSFDDLPAMHERMARRITELGGRGMAYLPAIRQQFGEKSLRGGLSLLQTVLPDEEVQVGSTWKETSNNIAGFSRDVDATYRLAKLENRIAVIDADITIRPPTPGEKEEARRAPRQWFEMSGSDAGSYRVDLATGWIVNAQTEQSMKGTTHSRRGANEVVAARMTRSSQPRAHTRTNETWRTWNSTCSTPAILLSRKTGRSSPSSSATS